MLPIKTFYTVSAKVLLLVSCLSLLGCSQVYETKGAVPVTDKNDHAHGVTYLQPQYKWEKPLNQAPAKEGYFEVNGAKLWYWDTGGEGEVVVFSHPASGSGLTWEYQHPVLVKAGYRVIGYSRRGFYQSEVSNFNVKESASEDLIKLLDHLQVDKFHIVAIAAGGNIAPDLADAYPERVLSLMMGCTIGRTSDKTYLSGQSTLRPDEFNKLPVYIKELSPFYRSANPEGTLAWKEISDKAHISKRVPAYIRQMTPDILANIKQPTLLFTGDSDFYMPPSRLRNYAKYWNNPEVVVFRGAGHAPYWEQPVVFNELLLDFLRRSSNTVNAKQ